MLTITAGSNKPNILSTDSNQQQMHDCDTQNGCNDVGEKAIVWMFKEQTSQLAVWVRTKSGENPVEYDETWHLAKQFKCPLGMAAAEPALEGHELYATKSVSHPADFPASCV